MLPELVEDIEKIRDIKADTQIAFNISALDLYSPYLVKMLRSFIGSKRINPGNIQIELTEPPLSITRNGSRRRCLILSRWALKLGWMISAPGIRLWIY